MAGGHLRAVKIWNDTYFGMRPSGPVNNKGVIKIQAGPCN